MKLKIGCSVLFFINFLACSLNKPISLLDFIEKLEKEFGRTAIKDLKPIQPGDVEKTWANIEKLKNWCNYIPKTNFDEGIHNFANWYKSYYC